MRATLDEQQLPGSLRALVRARNHRSSPCSHALTVRVCLHVCEWMSKYVYALKWEMVKETPFPHVAHVSAAGALRMLSIIQNMDISPYMNEYK